RLMATRMDESFLLRSDLAGNSHMSTTSVALCTVMRSPGTSRRSSSVCDSACSSPTRVMASSACLCRQDSAASTATAWPWSPLMASTAIRVMWSSVPGAADQITAAVLQLDIVVDFHDTAAPVEAVARHGVTAMGLASSRVNGQRRLAQRVVTAALAALGTGCGFLLDGHVLLSVCQAIAISVGIVVALQVLQHGERVVLAPALRCRLRAGSRNRRVRVVAGPAHRILATRDDRQRQQQFIFGQRVQCQHVTLGDDRLVGMRHAGGSLVIGDDDHIDRRVDIVDERRKTALTL